MGAGDKSSNTAKRAFVPVNGICDLTHHHYRNGSTPELSANCSALQPIAVITDR
jgi:hypothetical protein